MLILRKTWCYICHLSDQRMMLRHFCMTDQMESSKSISFNHDGKDFFSTIQICFVRWCQNTVIGEKSSKGLRLITRQIYWLLLPFALGLDGHLTSSNKTKSHTHKKHYCPNTNHNQVNPYPNHSENYAALLDITNLAIWKIPLLIASHFSMFARTIGDWFSLDPWIIAWIPLLLWKTHCAPSEIGKCGIGYH